MAIIRSSRAQALPSISFRRFLALQYTNVSVRTNTKTIIVKLKNEIAKSIIAFEVFGKKLWEEISYELRSLYIVNIKQ